MKNLTLALAFGVVPVVMPVASASAAVIISEVNPNGSGAAYGADWFELTNTGTTAVDLTNWKMDDNSFALATAVPLRGVTSLPAGRSAVFLENGAFVDAATDSSKVTAFTNAWFASPPANLLVGLYGGSGVGLSSSGDGVELFDGNSAVVSGVNFGANAIVAGTPTATFDNRAGVGSTTTPFPTLTNLSVVGTNGAFTSQTTNEVGSPGAVPEPAGLLTLALGGMGLLKRRR